MRLYVDVTQHHSIKMRTPTYHQHSIWSGCRPNSVGKQRGTEGKGFFRCFFPFFFVPHHWDKNRLVVYKLALHLKAPDLLFSWHAKDLGNFSQYFVSCVLFVADKISQIDLKTALKFQHTFFFCLISWKVKLFMNWHLKESQLYAAVGHSDFVITSN